MGQIFSLTSEDAEKIIEQAMNLLRESRNVASISLVNRDGTEIAMSMMDGVKPSTQNVAILKAKQAAHTGKPTSVTRDDIIAGKVTAEVLGIRKKYLVPWAGGRPIYDLDGHLLGGIGVSNLAEEEDDRIARTAVGAAGFKACA
jgi:uncharacterized protein GlcG (DUF336 family)